MGPPYEVHTYNIDKLKELLAQDHLISIHDTDSKIRVINEKLHTRYLDNYFSHKSIEAKTIVVENKYIDRDYLDDFSHYYVRCFADYSRYCVRLHFFTKIFDSTDLQQLLSGDDGTLTCENLNETYLGFLVVKPLPETIIGRACLKTYTDEPERRKFPISRTYDANLFGINLSVKTLAYQEQDSVVAVCATSALWSVFQGTGMLFHHRIPSPIEITKTATSRSTPETRTLTKTGLNSEQLALAIRAVGLEPYLAGVENKHLFTSNVYAYLKAKIPLILGIRLVDTSLDPKENINSIGFHAVAITGYSIGNTSPCPVVLEENGREFNLYASRIDKIYVHDDQVGPFARMAVDYNQVTINDGVNTTTAPSLTSSWKGHDKIIGSVRAVPVLLLAPLYHKIRIPFETIHHAVYRFDGFLETLRVNKKLPLADRLEWDIFLTTVNDFKSDILCSPTFRGKKCQPGALISRMPRFIWRATAYHQGTPITDLIFDATDIEQGQFFICALGYHEVVASILYEATKELESLSEYRSLPEWKIITWFSKQRAD